MIKLTIEPGSEEFVALWKAMHRNEPVRLKIEPGRTERVFSPGDKVIVPFDFERGPAVVDGTGRMSDGTPYVRIKYGPKDRPNDLKFSTSLHPDSIDTDHVIEHPPTLKVDA